MVHISCVNREVEMLRNITDNTSADIWYIHTNTYIYK